MKIIHLSDIHIRAGDPTKCRYNEYLDVFTKFLDYLYNNCVKEDTICVITGDIFHHKNKIEAAGIKLFLYLIEGIALGVEHIIIIPGNHDFRQEAPTEPNLIHTILKKNIAIVDDDGGAISNVEGNCGNGITYLDYSTNFKLEFERDKGNGDKSHISINFATVCIQDVLQYCATTGLADELPEFPKPDPSCTHNIALFHGMIGGKKSNTIVPKKWFDGYDLVMLGDIHLQQVIGGTSTGLGKPEVLCDGNIALLQKYECTSAPTFAYAGSMIQQDFGETLLGHGFLSWDLDEMTVSCYQVNNDIGFITVDQENRVHLKYGDSSTYLAIENVAKVPWFPKKVMVRGKNIANAECECTKNGIEVLSSSIFNNNSLDKDKSGKDKKDVFNDTDIIVETLPILCSPENWIKYIKASMVKKENEIPFVGWENWLLDPAQYLRQDIPKERVDRVNKKLDLYLDSNQKRQNRNLKISWMHWEWMLCFGTNNYFDFSQMDGNINIINGKNGQGKTSFLECICIGLFGEGFPSRYNKNYTASLINNNKPLHSAAFVQIVVNDKYLIRRGFHTQDKDKTKIHAASKDTFVKELESDVTLAKGKTAVDKWVNAQVGTIDSFLMSCMLTQASDKDFFALTSAEQKGMLDTALNLDSHSLMIDLLKEVKLAFVFRASVLKEKIADRANTMVSVNAESDLKEIQEQIVKLKANIQNYENLLETMTCKYPVMTLEEARSIIQENKDANGESKDKDGVDDDAENNEGKEDLDVINYILKQLNGIDFTSFLTSNGIQGEPIERTKTFEEARSSHAFMMKWKDNLDRTNIHEQKRTLSQIKQDLKAHEDMKPSKVISKRKNEIVFRDDRYQELKAKYSDINLESYHQQVDYKRFDELMKKWGDNEGMGGLAPPPPVKKPLVTKMNWTWELFEEMSAKSDYEVSEENLTELIEYRDSLKKDLGKYHEYSKELQNIGQMMTQYNDFPFNPACDACNKAPWKVHLTELTTRKEKCEKVLKKLGKIEEMKENIEDANTQLAILNELVLMKPALEYQDYTSYQEWLAMKKVAEIQELCDMASILYIEWEKQYNDLKSEMNDILYQNDIELHGSLESNVAIMWAWKQYYTEKKKKLTRQKVVRDALNTIEFYEHKDLSKKLLNANVEVARLEKEKAFIENAKDVNNAVHEECEGLAVKIGSLETILNLLASYQMWIYRDQVIPLICSSVNNLLNVMGLEETHRLTCRFYAENTVLDWFLGNPPIERASGFQRFICSLAMRIALSRIGASEIRNKQLFLDEGFTACDSENLTKVPGFLQGLLCSALYDSIILVTHLEELKDSVNVCFDIQTDFSGCPTV